MIDIIIVNYNSTAYLLKSLKSVYNSIDGFPVNIFVEDNGSKDHPERIKKYFPKTHVSLNKSNMGFASTVNCAIKKNNAPYIILLNPDTVIKRNFFHPIFDFMEKNPSVAVVGPKVLNEDGTIQGSARTFPTLLTGLFGRRSILSKLFPNNRFTRDHIATTRCDGKSTMAVDWVSGACMLIRREALAEVGLLDEQFFMYWEDADFCRRMWDHNWMVVYYPKVSILHHVGASSNTLRIKSTIEFHKSSYRIYKKYTKWPFIWTTAAILLTVRCILICYSHIIRRMLKK